MGQQGTAKKDELRDEHKGLPGTSRRIAGLWFEFESEIDHPEVEETEGRIYRALKQHGGKVSRQEKIRKVLEEFRFSIDLGVGLGCRYGPSTMDMDFDLSIY